MQLVSRNLLETALRLSIVASSDETRMNLNGVHVFKRDKSILIEACDGHKATRETLVGDSSDLGDADLILCRKDLKKLKQFLKAYAGKNEFECELAERSLVVKCGPDLVSIFRINREFPKLDSVIPTNRPNDISVSFNPKYLMDLFESLKLDKRQVQVTLSFDPYNTMSPLLVEIEGNNGRAQQVSVLMPCKSDKAKASELERNNKVTA